MTYVYDINIGTQIDFTCAEWCEFGKTVGCTTWAVVTAIELRPNGLKTKLEAWVTLCFDGLIFETTADLIFKNAKEGHIDITH